MQSLGLDIEFDQQKSDFDSVEFDPLLSPRTKPMQSVWYFHHSSLFNCLSLLELAELEKGSLKRDFKRGAAIYLPQELARHAFLLAKGRVRIGTVSGDGKQIVLALIEQGQLFGELAILDADVRQDRAEAMTPCTVVAIPAANLMGLMEKNAKLSIGITKLIGLRRKRIEQRISNLLFRSNRERLGHLLLELADQFGSEIGDAVEIDLRLSHQELASIIGVTRESITITLGQFRNEGLVDEGRKRHIIIQRERLERSLRDNKVVNPVNQSKATHNSSTIQTW
jgi:CRP/FNR family transcriptional regulator, cyclic AMP receptor protein